MRRFGEIAQLQDGESAVRDRQARARHVRRAVRPCRDHPARRPRPCHAGHRSGAGAVSRRDRPAVGPRRAGRRPCRRRRRNAADSAGALRALLVAEADLGERIMRALILRRVSLIQGGAGGPVLIGPPNSAASSACRAFSPATAIRIICSIPDADQRCRRTDRALFAVAGGLAAGGGARRHRAAQSRANPNWRARSA